MDCASVEACGTQDIALTRVEIVAHVVKHQAAGMKWARIAAELPTTLGKCPVEQTVKRWLKVVEGVDPANWAPALAPDYATTGRPCSDCDPAAWTEFETRIAASGRNETGANFKTQWQNTKDKACSMGAADFARFSPARRCPG